MPLGSDAGHPLDQFSFTGCVLIRHIRWRGNAIQTVALSEQTLGAGCQHGLPSDITMLLNPFCPISSAKVLALKATVLLLLTLLIKARVQILTGSALGILLLLLQTLVFLAISGGLVLAAGGAAVYANQQRRSSPA